MNRVRAFLARDREQGSSTLELAVWGTVIAAVLVLFAGAMRMTSAMQSVEAAAAAAARAATLENSVSDATAAAESMATDALAIEEVDCASLTVTVDAQGVDAALGQTGSVTANVACTVSLSNAAIIGLPGTKTMTGSATVSYDAFKERD